jgi:hypothetical protein
MRRSYIYSPTSASMACSETVLAFLISDLINALKPKLVYIVFKNSVRTSKRTPHFTITAINLLTLFKEIIHIYAENHSKPTNT